MSNIKSFTIYREYYDLLSLLDEIEQEQLLLSICRYMFENKEPNLNERQMKIFSNLKRPLDKSKNKSKSTSKLSLNKIKSKSNQNQNEIKNKTHQDVNVNNHNDNYDYVVNVDVNNNLFSFIESNFGRTLNSIEYEEIKNWEDNELTRYAITQAVLNNVYTVNYIKKILDSYNLKNIKTVAEAQKDDEDFQRKKLTKSQKDECLTFQEQERMRRKKAKEDFLRKHGELK